MAEQKKQGLWDRVFGPSAAEQQAEAQKAARKKAADEQYARDAAAMADPLGAARKAAAAAAAPTPAATPTASTPSTPATPTATPPDRIQQGADAFTKPRVDPELMKQKKGGVTSCATGGVIDKELLRRKAAVKQKRGC